MDRLWFGLGSLFGFIAVAGGAFGAHFLRNRLAPDLLSVFETGVRYQFYHALALLALAWASTRFPGTATTIAGWAFTFGIVVFSGSLYVLALTGTRWLGAITPIGGLAFLVGWMFLLIAAWK